MKIFEALRSARQLFAGHGFEEPQSEAEILLAGLLQQDRAALYSQDERELTESEAEAFMRWVRRRGSGEPMAYILGRKPFFKSDFLVGPGVLIPRPETELLVEGVLRVFADHSQPLRIADFGCGSGCIGLSLLMEYPSANLWAVDISPAALDWAQKNAAKMEVEGRVNWQRQNVTDFSANTKMDVVVANPPYISRKDSRVAPDVLQHEPELALFSDQEGLAAIHSWLAIAAKALRPGGWVFMEIGAGQCEQVLVELSKKDEWGGLETTKDLAGWERMIAAQRRSDG